ncbi:hypothetical protein GCM10007049_06910 [Echinicola pacifica]|uniref:Uncharacterized protein n=1 Tax=Echinicola pacifica TaxID=346377 RepID=A0A918PNN3_9BACT|nr:hypothetical protein [Echinicola pacifica]GGZ17135.1 hypothetical protein GCM10007049_06910 [Echinicola pacifica]
MTIKVTNAPTNTELLSFLQSELPSNYKSKLFGLGDKSIIVQKPTFLGVQLTVRENEISILASPPSYGGGLLSGLAMTELAIVILPIFWLTGASPSRFRKLEKEVASLLKENYN